MRILLISFSDLKNDPRVFRQISRLYQNNDVTCIGNHHPGIEPVKFIQYTEKKIPVIEKIYRGILLLTGNYERYEQRKYTLSNFNGLLPREEKFDLIIANDIEALPLVWPITGGAKILYDAHEYSPGEFEDDRIWKLLMQKFREYQCRKYLPRCDSMMTVCEGIADAYHDNFGVRPVVITSASEYQDRSPHEADPQRIRIIHHGAAISSRGLETMISMMDYVDSRFTLDLMLVPNEKKYHQLLIRMAVSRDNVRIIDPVPMKDIVKKCNEYDIGLYLLESTSLNNRYALPNKFFEFIQARLAIAIGPSIEMARLVKKYDLGVVSDDFSPKKMAELLNRLTSDEIRHYQMQAHQAAKILSSEENMMKFDKIIADLVPNDGMTRVNR